MDLNLAVIAGNLSAEPEIRVFDTKEPDDPQLSNINVVRLLVTTRTESPKRRIDVIPVSWWCSDDELAALELRKGDRVWVAGAVQRAQDQPAQTAGRLLGVLLEDVSSPR